MSRNLDFNVHENAKCTSGIRWESRYDGALDVAMIDNKAVAGISGPWPDGLYALIWWSLHHSEVVPGLEFHPSMRVAHERVEEMVSRSA